MLNLEEVTLYSLAVHWVGNRKEGEELILSNSPIELDVGEVKRMLMRYFLSAFKEPAFFQFYPQENLAYNEVFQTARKIFADKNTFFPASAHLAQHLYDVSTHPSIRGGEFFVAYFKNCSLDSTFVDAVGLFKAENKETLLKVYPSQDNFRLGKEEGININKLDKGCLIFNIDEENGYKVLVVDRIAKDSIAQFWKDDFLQIRQREDKFFHTHQYLHLCKGFVDDVFNAEHHIDKAEQSAMLHRTYQYFAEKDSFNRMEFENEVIQEPSVVDAFEEYKQKYEQERNLHMNDEFPIAVETVKRNKRFFRSVIKLDKNFSLYVHGDREMIERGYDQERKMMYYKLFFKEES